MKIAYSTAAIRALARLPKDVRDRIVARLEDIAANPAAFPKVTKLTGRESLRLRIGDWRAIVILSDDLLTVQAIGHRRDIYR